MPRPVMAEVPMMQQGLDREIQQRLGPPQL